MCSRLCIAGANGTSAGWSSTQIIEPVQRIRAGGKSPPARTVRTLPTLQCQEHVVVRPDSLAAVHPDAASTDQLNDAGSHGGRV